MARLIKKILNEKLMHFLNKESNIPFVLNIFILLLRIFTKLTFFKKRYS